MPYVLASATAWLAAAVPCEAACLALTLPEKLSHGACSPAKAGSSDQPAALACWTQPADRLFWPQPIIWPPM